MDRKNIDKAIALVRRIDCLDDLAKILNESDEMTIRTKGFVDKNIKDTEIVEYVSHSLMAMKMETLEKLEEL